MLWKLLKGIFIPRNKSNPKNQEKCPVLKRFSLHFFKGTEWMVVNQYAESYQEAIILARFKH